MVTYNKNVQKINSMLNDIIICSKSKLDFLGCIVKPSGSNWNIYYIRRPVLETTKLQRVKIHTFTPFDEIFYEWEQISHIYRNVTQLLSIDTV